MTTPQTASSPHAARTAAQQPASQQPGPAARAATTKEEAARQFESVLVRQFVEVMTKKMFDAPLSGEGGPGWMNSQRDTQRDIMTDVLTDHLVDAGALQLSDLLLRKWDAGAAEDAAPVADAASEKAPPPAIAQPAAAPFAPLSTPDAPTP